MGVACYLLIMMAAKKKQRGNIRTDAGANPMEEVRKAMDMVHALREEMARMKRSIPPNAERLTEDELKVGARVSASIGPRKYALAEIVSVYTNDADGKDHVYYLRRLDGGRKGLGYKPPSHLYPASRAKLTN